MKLYNFPRLAATLILIVLAVASANGNAAISNKGKEFLFAFPQHGITAGTYMMSVSSEVDTQVVIEIPSLSYVKKYDVMANHQWPRVIMLPNQLQVHKRDEITNQGIRVTANNEVTVVGISQTSEIGGASLDSFLALPVEMLGTEYIAISYKDTLSGKWGSSANPDSYENYPSQMVVIGVHDNTEVTITPADDSSFSKKKGEPYTIVLDRNETYMLASVHGDITGTVVTSTSPVAVMSSVACAYVPENIGACDHIVEMLPPVSVWGKSFITAPLEGRKKGEVFRVLASEDNTIVSIDDVEVAHLNKSEFYETILTSASTIEASEPIMVAQYSVGFGYDSVVGDRYSIGDPFMMLVTPTAQFSNKYTLPTFNGVHTPFDRNKFNLIVPNEDISTCKLNNNIIDPSLFKPVLDSGYSYASIIYDVMYFNSVECAKEFGAYGYAFGDAVSYGNPGGFKINEHKIIVDSYHPNLRIQFSNNEIIGIAEDNEDINLNGILEANEDLNGNGVIDRRTEDLNGNGVLDPGEDTNNNNLLDRDSGIYTVKLEESATNLQLELIDFVPGSLHQDFIIRRIDDTLPGNGVLIVIDGTGNTVTRQISIADKQSLHNVRLVSTLSSDRIDLDNSSFSTPPVNITSDSGETTIEWQFDTVYIDQIENLKYDVVFRSPMPGEKRLVTQKLDIYYIDINGNEAHSGLGETTVDVLPSIVQINIATDKSTYTANETVSIDAAYKNVSDFENTLDVKISILDSEGAVITTLIEQSDVAVASGETWEPMNLTFPTGNLYEGLYEVRAELLDNSGAPTIHASAPFLIAPSTDVTVSAKISSDKYLYDPFESATLHDRVNNTTSNTVLDGMTVTTSVYTPDNNLFWTQTGALPEILPNSASDINYPLPLARALPGKYRAVVVVKDSQGIERALSETAFEVSSSADTGTGLAGEISLAPPSGHVLRTESLNLAANVQNLGNATVADLPVSLKLIDPVNQQVVARWDELIGSLAMQAEYPFAHDWRAMAPVGSTYVAILSATVGDKQKVLASKNITIGEKIKSAFTEGTRGRLLVLLDEEQRCKDKGHRDGKDKDFKHKERCEERHDSKRHGNNDIPSFEEQRAFLEARLRENGWSYTIVTDADDFAREMRSSGYVAYVLLSEGEKLDEQVQRELRERIYRGEGLLVAGTHDERNSHLDSALGIKIKGKYTKVDSFTFLESPLGLTDGQNLPHSEDAVRIAPNGAEVAATFDFQDFGHKRDKHILETGVQTCDQGKGKPKDSNAAVTTYQFGLGHSVYAAFDLLAQATAAQNENLIDDLLVTALTYSHPQNLEAVQTKVIPVSLMLTNVGSEAAGRVLITLPEGVQIIDPGIAVVNTDGELVWAYGLGTDESTRLDFWVHIPDVITDFTFSALIQIGQEPGWEDYGTTELVIRPGVYSGLYDAINELSSLLSQDRHYRNALQELQHADRAVQRSRWDEAMSHMLKATDMLAQIRHDRANDIRVMVDNAIALYAQQLKIHHPDRDRGHERY